MNINKSCIYEDFGQHVIEKVEYIFSKISQVFQINNTQIIFKESFQRANFLSVQFGLV